MNRSEMLEKMHVAVGMGNVQMARNIAMEYHDAGMRELADDLHKTIDQKLSVPPNNPETHEGFWLCHPRNMHDHIDAALARLLEDKPKKVNGTP